MINYTIDGVAALEALVSWPPALRWLVFRSGWLRESRPLQQHRATMACLIAPYVRSSAGRDTDTGGSGTSRGGSSSDDERRRNLLFWTMLRTAATGAAAAAANVAQQAQH